MKLKTLQSEIQKAVVNGDHDVSTVVVSDHLLAEDRIATYARSSFLKPFSVVSDDFLVTRIFLGEDRFDELLEKYLQMHPPNTHYINEAGRAFSDFLKKHLDAKDIDFIFDLAQVEWLRNESFFNFFDHRKSNEPNLQKGHKNILVNPSIMTFQSQWPIAEIWDSEKSYDKKESLVYIWTTEDRKVHLESWYGFQAKVLAVILKCETLEQAIEKLADQFETDQLTQVFSETLPQWVNQGLLEIHDAP